MDGQVLVLNQNYEPLNITSMRRAVSLLHLGKAEVVEQFDSRVRTVTRSFAAPSVVRLSYYVRRPLTELRVSRRGVFARDEHTCCYCGAADVPLTLDHVVPVSRGGQSTWGNLVTCCVACNHTKGSRTPAEAGLALAFKPFRPRFTPHLSFAQFVGAVRSEHWGLYLAPYAAGAQLFSRERSAGEPVSM